MTNAKLVTVREYMSPVKYTAAPDEELAVAYERMQSHNVRHLPVQQGGELVGVLFKSDLKLFEIVDPSRLPPTKVSTVMVRQSYTVDPGAPIDRVAREMSRQKYGSAIVVEDGKVVGVFTNTDALKALSDALTDSLPEPTQVA